MPGLAALATSAGPIAGGVLLAVAGGQLLRAGSSGTGKDVHATIKANIEVLAMIAEEETDRRAGLQRAIDADIDDLIAASDRSRALREAAVSYRGNWRDIVVFVCAVLFTYLWWHVNHHRSDWLLVFIVMVGVSILTAAYAALGASRSMSTLLHRHGRAGQP